MWKPVGGHSNNFRQKNEDRILKKFSENEFSIYKSLKTLYSDDVIHDYIPKTYGIVADDSGKWFEMENLLQRLKGIDHSVTDIKMGTRTFSLKEVWESKEREDLFNKYQNYHSSLKADNRLSLKKICEGLNSFDSVDSNDSMSKLPSTDIKPKLKELISDYSFIHDSNFILKKEEVENKKMTKYRYLCWRDRLSTTFHHGYRIEAMQIKGNKIPKHDLISAEIANVEYFFQKFLNDSPKLIFNLQENLEKLRSDLCNSMFFKNHQLIATSLLIYHDDNRCNVNLIDFAKTVVTRKPVTHLKYWIPMEEEDGFLIGLNNLIEVCQKLHM
ncbi:hypothetical protein SNEBB_000634 [Seison nebaliae]|nr:hypothetical protein SNEBB_000634 [Seison nebaliae]